MVVVFWLEEPQIPDEKTAAHHRAFPPAELAAGLRFAEELRARRRAGERISHVTIQSELPESVGFAGVADPESGYAHYKRRLDPAMRLGRDPLVKPW